MNMKKRLGRYYNWRASTYSELDEPGTIVSYVRSVGIKDHMKIINPKQDDKILDVGCGTGRFLAHFPKTNAIGVDFSLNMLMEAKKTGVALVCGDAEHLPFKDDSFDVVHSAGLMGVFKSKKIVEEMARVTHPGKHIYVSFPVTLSASGLVALLFLKLGRGKYNPSLFDCWYTEKDIATLFPKSLDVEGIMRLGWEFPFQRFFLRFKSRRLTKLFALLEKSLRNKPILKFLCARSLVKARKMTASKP